MTSRSRTVPALLLGLYCLLQAGTASGDHDGDINIDGTVNIVDLLWAQQTLLGSRALGPAQTLHADVAPLVAGIPAPDGAFNTGDLTVILRIALGDLGLLKPAWPGNQFNIGDSIGEGEAAYNDIGNANHETVWSTGYDAGDSVASLNERIEALVSAYYHENTAGGRDAVFNRALSGAVMAGFASQAQGVVTAAAQTPTADAGMVTVLLGNNDVCASSMANMTAPALFEAQYRAGLDVLAASDATRNARIHVSGIPAIYWLWNARFSNFWCRVFAWPFVPCENLLDNPGDDCVHAVSRQDPDTVYPGDGTNCQRRKAFHRIVRDDYNTVLRDVLEEYRQAGALPNAAYTDVYDVRFDAGHVNSGDCFHPSVAGHALLAQEEWLRTPWGQP